MCNFSSRNFLSLSFVAALGLFLPSRNPPPILPSRSPRHILSQKQRSSPIATQLRRLRRPNQTFRKLPLGKFHIWEVAIWEIVTWEVALGKIVIRRGKTLSILWGEMSVKLKPHGSLFPIKNIPLHNHNLRKQNSVPIYSRENGEVKKIDHVSKDY